MAGEEALFGGAAGRPTQALTDIGGFINQMNPPQQGGINPALAAWFQQQGIDLNRYLAGQGVQATNFGQTMQQYPLRAESALQGAYAQDYGGIEGQARNYATSALAGTLTPATQNILNQMNIASAQASRNAMRQSAAQASAMNINPSSPAYQAMLRGQQGDLQRSNALAKAGVINQQADQGIQNALRIMENAQTSNRLASAKMPDIPLNYNQAVAKANQDKQNAIQGYQIPSSAVVPGLANTYGRSIAGANAYNNALSSSGYSKEGIPSPTRYNVADFYNQAGKPINPGLKSGGGSLWGSIGKTLKFW